MRKTLSVFVAILCLAAVLIAQEDEVLELKKKIVQIQNKGDLAFGSLALCSKILGFGSYVTLPDNVIDARGSLLLYYEPVNVFTNIRNGVYETWYKQDLALYQGAELLQEWKDFLQFRHASNKPVFDLYARNSLDFEGQLPPGDYSVKLTLKDQFSGKTVETTVEFKLK